MVFPKIYYYNHYSHPWRRRKRRRNKRLIQREKQNACIVALGIVLPVPHIGHLLFRTLTFTLHGFLNYHQHLHAIYQVLCALWFAVVFCPLGFQADWKERGSCQDISYSCFLSANNFGITLCKGHWSLKCCGLCMTPSLQGFGNFWKDTTNSSSL